MAKQPPGVQPCVIHGGLPLNKIRPIGPLVIVILYWGAILPQFAAWRGQLESALPAAVAAVSVQLIVGAAVVARLAGKQAWSRTKAAAGAVGTAALRGGRWVAARVQIRAGLTLRLGES